MKQDDLLLMLLMVGIAATMLAFSGPFAIATNADDDDDGNDDDGNDDDDGQGKLTLCPESDGTGSTAGNPLKNTHGDVKVLFEGNCFIEGAHITGNVQAEDSPGVVSVINSDIEGSVQVKGATGPVTVMDNDMTIFGNIQISESDNGSITVTGNTQPDGNIQIDKNKVAGDINVNYNTLEHGNIQLKENVDPDSGDAVTANISVTWNTLDHGNIQLEKEKVTGSISVNNNILTEEGDIQLKTNKADNGISVDDNELTKGNIEVAENETVNSDITIKTNTKVGGASYDGDMKVEKNDARPTGEIIVEDNKMTGVLECKDNESVVVGSGNTASEKKDDCKLL